MLLVFTRGEDMVTNDAGAGDWAAGRGKGNTAGASRFFGSLGTKNMFQLLGRFFFNLISDAGAV